MVAESYVAPAPAAVAEIAVHLVQTSVAVEGRIAEILAVQTEDEA